MMGGVDGGWAAVAIRWMMRLVTVRPLTRRLALHPRGPGQRQGVGAVLALLGLHWGWAADALACAACLQPSAKRWGGSVGLASLGLDCLAWFTRLASGLSR